MTPAMQSLLLILPIALPLLSAALGLLFVRSRPAQFVFGVGHPRRCASRAAHCWRRCTSMAS